MAWILEKSRKQKELNWKKNFFKKSMRRRLSWNWLEERKTKKHKNGDGFFEFLIGNAELGTYDKGYIGKGEKKNPFTTWWLRNFNASQKTQGYTKTKISVTNTITSFHIPSNDDNFLNKFPFCPGNMQAYLMSAESIAVQISVLNDNICPQLDDPAGCMKGISTNV